VIIWSVGILISLGVIVLLVTLLRVKLSPRLTILIVALLVILTLIFIWWGNRNGASRSFRIDLDVPTVQQVRSFFTTKFSPEEVQIAQGRDLGCRVEGRRIIVPMDETCSFSLKPAPNRTKQIVVRLAAESDSVDLTLAQENALTIEQTLLSEQTSENLDVYRNEGEINAMLTFFNCQLPEPEDRETEEPTLEIRVCFLDINP